MKEKELFYTRAINAFKHTQELSSDITKVTNIVTKVRENRVDFNISNNGGEK